VIAGAGALGARLDELVVDGDDDATCAALAAAGLTDGLPVVAPTPARLEAFAAAAPAAAWRGGALLLSPGPPAPGDLVAVCVMAGCPPEALPVVTAALGATTQPPFNLLGVQTTTSSVAPFVVVHGWRGGAVPGAGRAVALAQRILGGVLAGVADVRTMQPPPGAGWCVVEAAHPWAGAGPAVTVGAMVGWAEVVLGQATLDDDLAALAAAAAGVGVPQRGVVAVLPPEAADRLAVAGRDPAHLVAEVPALVRVVVAGGVGVKAVVVPLWGASELVHAPLA
jgi:hypothetical protein